MQPAARISFLFAGLLLAPPACVPYIHPAVSSPHMQGRVLDARAHSSLPGVKVQVKDRPATAVATDASGRFDLPEHDHMELWMVMGICGSTGPGPEYCKTLEFSRAGWEADSVYAGDAETAPQQKDGVIHLKDVMLKRAGPFSTPHCFTR